MPLLKITGSVIELSYIKGLLFPTLLLYVEITVSLIKNVFQTFLVKSCSKAVNNKCGLKKKKKVQKCLLSHEGLCSVTFQKRGTTRAVCGQNDKRAVVESCCFVKCKYNRLTSKSSVLK